MSGESQRADEPDFLDDDFVVEDLAGKNDDLEQLFDDAAPPAPAAGPPDEEDELFTDHTPGAVSERFQGGAAFAEDRKSEWQGEGLELDEEHPQDPQVAAAAAAVNDELDAMLHGDEDLPLDGDAELELVDGPSAAAGTDEFEQSGPFVLDDGEEPAQQPADEEVDIQVEGAHADEPPAPVEPEVAEAIWEAVQEPVMADAAGEEAAVEEEGWEALPESNVDDLAEVDGVARADDEQPAPEDLEEVEGHDIYGEEEPAPVLVGAVSGRRRLFGMVAALAASLAVVAGGAVVLMRPQWVGLTLEPERVPQVQLRRPVVAVSLDAPAAPQLGHAPAGPETPPAGVADPVPPAVPDVPPKPADPVAGGPDTPAPVVPPAVDPVEPPVAPAPADPVAASPTPPVVPDGAAVAPAPTAAWPVAAVPAPRRTVRDDKAAGLVRVDEHMMVGELDPGATPPAAVIAVEGMVAGTRAFAQLRNGNYFIGSIKVAHADTVTLRLAEGEVTLAAGDIVRLTALGSADYEALQKATSGFVRLTNNNRLVGGILSQIADDHIVLEFRSNRVMLPRSAVSEVGGEPEQAVRLDVTREEEDWVRSLMERELGQDTARQSPAAAPSPR